MIPRSDKPIIFNTAMVQGVLRGEKTQTRRVVKLQPVSVRDLGDEEYQGPKQYFVENGKLRSPARYGSREVKCPYGTPGDLLWVRESFREVGSAMRDDGKLPEPGVLTKDDLVYKADQEWNGPWRPSIHMPKWAARIWLEITDVWMEPLQCITEEECLREGINPPRCPECGYTKWDCKFMLDHNICGHPDPKSGIPVFRSLWDSINAKRGYGWDENPWVWVIGFKRVQ